MEYWAAALFALAVSADGFVVGVAYGVRQIKIPIISLLVVSLASALAVSFSMFCGKGLALFLSQDAAALIGSALIIIIGLYFMLQAGKERIGSIDCSEDVPLLTLEIKTLGIIIHILKEPSSADFDASGEISLKEAFFLGIALAMDALGAGLGMAMAGCKIFFTALCVGVLKFILVNSGILLGRVLKSETLKNYSSLAAGLILIIIGVCELV